MKISFPDMTSLSVLRPFIVTEAKVALVVPYYDIKLETEPLPHLYSFSVGTLFTGDCDSDGDCCSGLRCNYDWGFQTDLCEAGNFFLPPVVAYLQFALISNGVENCGVLLQKLAIGSFLSSAIVSAKLKVQWKYHPIQFYRCLISVFCFKGPPPKTFLGALGVNGALALSGKTHSF